MVFFWLFDGNAVFQDCGLLNLSTEAMSAVWSFLENGVKSVGYITQISLNMCNSRNINMYRCSCINRRKKVCLLGSTYLFVCLNVISSVITVKLLL